jgi:two-component system CheB/CheR fusion protein
MATIMIIDDQAMNREYLVTLLGYAGHRLVQAANGAAGLATARIERPDLVIADILMPIMDGYEFVRQLRADPVLAATPVIFHTAHYLEREAQSLAQSCGVVHLLTKPCEPQEVLHTVATALGGGPPPTPPVPDPNFDRYHLRAVTDNLARKVAELEATELELEQRVKELAEADRCKNEFLAMLGHELRNPLAPICNALQIMRQRGLDDQDLTRWAHGLIERQVRHMTRLIDDLLDVARITRGTIDLRKERVDLATAVAHAVETMAPLINARGHHLTVTLPPGPLYLEADVTRLEQVLANLLHNAAKFTEPGGQIGLVAETEAGGVVIQVRDTGIGMAPEMLVRAFDLFAQANRSLDRAQGGLGIGLTMVRRLVEMHGGWVLAHSKGVGQGSELVVYLPTYGPATEALEATPTVAQATPRPTRILVADDNQDLADSCAEMLGRVGHAVQVAYSGPDALAAARAYQPEVVLLDLGLPGLDGYQVASQIRQMQGLEKAKIIAVSGYCGEEDRRRSQEAGFDSHLAKPVEPEVLFQLLAGPETPAQR